MTLLSWRTLPLPYITEPMLLTFFLHPRDVLHVLDVVESVADGGLGHGGGGGQAVQRVQICVYSLRDTLRGVLVIDQNG